MFPYLDFPGYKRRSILPRRLLDELERDEPGWIAQNLLTHSSWINTQLRKRYGAAAEGNSLPFGQLPPLAIGAGATPPALTLTGRPTFGSLQLVFQVVTPGASGTATVRWSTDGGSSFPALGPAIATTFSVPGTGLVATWAPGSFSADNVWSCATPVPETVLRWLRTLADYDVVKHHYRTTTDPALIDLKDDVATVRTEIQQAANSKDGMWDLPSTEDADSAITAGGPLGYSETSPYTWTDRQARDGTFDDVRGGGS